MKASIFFMILSIVSLSFISSHSDLQTQDYVHLIFDVYDMYQPSSVLLVYFANIDCPSEMYIVFEIMLMFSKKKILTQTVQLEQTQNTENYFDNNEQIQEIRQTSRSMNLIILTSQEAIEKLKNFPKHIKLHTSINFVLFMAKEKYFDGFCMESIRNKLEFIFLDTILIKCYEDPFIKQWYPFDDNETNLITRAYWDSNDRSFLKMPDFIHRRKSDLDGKVLRIATVEASCLTQWENGKLVGYLADLLQILEGLMNFKTKHVKEESDFGSWNNITQTWSGAMGLIVRGEVDLIVSDLSMSSLRLRDVDFSEPLFLTQSQLYIKPPSNKRTIVWSGYLQPFSYQIWRVIILVLVITPLLLTFMKIIINDSYKWSSLMSECYLNVWGIFCQQGLKEFPTVSSLRLAYFSILISSFIIVSLYSASLISYLTVPILNPPFSTLEGFVADGSHKLCVIKDGSDYDMFRNSNDSTLSKMNHMMMPKKDLPSNVQAGFDLMCNNKIAFYNSDILTENDRNNISCQIVKIASGRYDTKGMVLQKGSLYKRAINYHIVKLRSKGILNHLNMKYFRKIVQPKFKTFTSVGLSETAVILIIIIGGVIFGFIILLIEKIYNNKL